MTRVNGLLRLCVLLLGMASWQAALAQTIPSFVEETKSAGLKSVYAGEWQYMVGGGVAVFDCNADGYPDMFLAGGENKAKFYANRSGKGGPLRFEEQQSGLELDAVTGAYPLDVDGDGVTDLVVLRVGEAVAMRGLGGCMFERANEAWGFSGGDAWWTAFSATWEHGADWPTLALGSYIDRTQEFEPWGSCTDNWLERPKKKRLSFDAPDVLKPSFCALSMLFTDWNRSGTPSLRVSNDREYYVGGSEQMWRVEPGKPPTLYTAADGWRTVKLWGMGIASYDVNGDGYPDYYLSSMSDQRLQMLADTAPGAASKPIYRDVPFSMGINAFRPYTGGDIRPSTGWHTQFEDVNNDGLVDIFVAKGNVDEMPDFAARDPNNLLLQKPDGNFMEAGDKAGVASFETSRGAALADFNLDGKLDLVVVNRRAPAQAWRNTSLDLGHWLGLRLRQSGANRDAVGAWVEVKRGAKIMRREVTAGGGHASGQLTWIHFGLGSETAAQVRVLWPDGEQGPWRPLDGDAFYTLSKDRPAEAFSGR